MQNVFNVFEMVYNSCVNTICDYAHDVIGFHQYSDSDQTNSKAIRSNIGVGHSAPLCAIRSYMSWLEPRSRTQMKMLRFHFRMMQMSSSRLNKQIFRYDQHISKCNPNICIRSNEITQILVRNDFFFFF